MGVKVIEAGLRRESRGGIVVILMVFQDFVVVLCQFGAVFSLWYSKNFRQIGVGQQWFSGAR